MSTRITIESDEPCIVLVLPLPRRVEPPKRAPRRVIETTGESVPPSAPGLRSAQVVQFPSRRVASR